MSNSFTTPPTLADEVTVVAGQVIGEGAVTAMSDTANYLYAHGGTHNVLSQAWAEGQFTQKGTTYQPMVEYVIPVITLDHYELHLHLIALGPGGIRSTLTIGSDVYTAETLSTGAGPHIIEQTVTVTSTPTANYATLSIEVKHTTGTPNHHEIRTLAAHWVAKASPLSAGVKLDADSNAFTPFGLNRVGMITRSALDGAWICLRTLRRLDSVLWSTPHGAGLIICSMLLHQSQTLRPLSIWAWVILKSYSALFVYLMRRLTAGMITPSQYGSTW